MPRLTKKKWEKIKIEYCSTDLSYAKLAKKYHVAESTIAMHAQAEKWQKLVKDIEENTIKKLNQKIVDDISDQRVAANERHIKISADILDLVERCLAAEGLSKDKFVCAKLKSLADTLSSCQKTQRTALNMDAMKPEDDTPKINFIKGIDLDNI